MTAVVRAFAPEIIAQVENQAAQVGSTNSNTPSSQVGPRDGPSASPTSPVTRISEHGLGETFSDWITAEKIDLSSACQNHSPLGPSIHENIKNWVLCDILAPIRDTGNGYYQATGHDFKWTLKDGKLAIVTRQYPAEEFSEQLGFLKETYGQNYKLTTVPVQNAFGATWSDTIAAWNMPDGVVITLVALGGPKPSVIVRFELAAKAPESKRNPYTSVPQ